MSLKSNKGLLSLMRYMDVLRFADPFEKIPHLFSSLFSLFWRVRPQGGSFPQLRVWDIGTEGKTDREKNMEKKLHRSLYLHHSPGAHYPDDITHAHTALFRVLLLIELLNDVESFKTNSVFCVWWLNDMDFHHCGLSWNEGRGWYVHPCACVECVMKFESTHTQH